ncbi:MULTISPECIES: hypothetical protein [Actinosynnema]|uniref:hypothetical protein n=1 Tax=Actinosynnema TaxID=40566 RepID=UPI0020A5A5A8|nr:hypothetical protein [Actinosynnema pretiosum]MCP2097381.1 hypothetical protein [Actinosynnema pretiosum]
MSTTVQPIYLDPADLAVLYLRRAGQTDHCHLVLDLRDGDLAAHANQEVEDRDVPESVVSGTVLRWSIPRLTPGDANRLIDQALPLARRVLAGFTTTLDTQRATDIGVLDRDATAARDEIEELVADYRDHGQVIGEMDADE